MAPMGVRDETGLYLIAPFRPSRTLDNLLRSGHAVINYTDDVRIFAGFHTGRRDWPMVPAGMVRGVRLAQALAHVEVEVARWEDDEIRPRIFRGFNRAGRWRARPMPPFGASTARRRRLSRLEFSSAACAGCRRRRSTARWTTCASRSRRPPARASAKRGSGWWSESPAIGVTERERNAGDLRIGVVALGRMAFAWPEHRCRHPWFSARAKNSPPPKLNGIPRQGQFTLRGPMKPACSRGHRRGRHRGGHGDGTDRGLRIRPGWWCRVGVGVRCFERRHLLY